ncbi:hypothetical protein KC332_g7860 [Hortaea werneckii]|nr:hypothetical protein KC332_g7860 [Hortaea werneckii]
MSEQADLQARIAAIAGKINQHKQQQYDQPPPPPHPIHVHRWSPYGRGGRPIHKNRTLVVGGQQEGFVAARGINNQLMTKEAYDREQAAKQESKEQHRANKRQKRNEEEQNRILRYTEESHLLDVAGLRFRVAAQGSKLVRVYDGVTDSQETPKRAQVLQVNFFRTKHGNLARAGALARASKHLPQCETFTRHGIATSKRPREHTPAVPSPPCWPVTDVHLGSCPFGSRCRFAHDPHKVAICKDYLKSGMCPRGNNCDMSHEMTYHRVPACTFFLRGNCTNSACRYPHVNVSPAAPVCRSFATLGFCAKGPDCDKRHVVECPDYANHGFCADRDNGLCYLPHPDRAAILRKAAERQAKIEASQDFSDLSSDDDGEPDESEDVDSDVEIIVGEDTHEVSQQQDFVKVA